MELVCFQRRLLFVRHRPFAFTCRATPFKNDLLSLDGVLEHDGADVTTLHADAWNADGDWRVRHKSLAIEGPRVYYQDADQGNSRRNEVINCRSKARLFFTVNTGIYEVWSGDARGRSGGAVCLEPMGVSFDLSGPNLSAEEMSMANHNEIERRAYELYEERGREGGHDWEDWFQAERELESAKAAAVGSEAPRRRRSEPSKQQP